jgi:TonB-linked SusC/RagA family outer membrane protein
MRSFAYRQFKLLVQKGLLKTLLIMNLTTVFLFAVCMSASANLSSQSVSLAETNAPLEKIFREINRQTGYTFVYTRSVLKKSRSISINVQNASIERSLDMCLEAQPLTYTILNTMIIIKEKKPVAQKEIQEEAFDPPPAMISISGRVTDENGLPLEGATILVKGSSSGVKSDANGNFSIEAQPNSILVISFVGFETIEVKTDNRANITVQLKSAVAINDEVLVIGYGTQKKSDVTGSIARITMDDKATQGNVNLFQALVGASAGVNLEGRGGSDGEPTLSVRGQTSLSASDRPLIVLDGVIYNGSIANINVNDVETIDILKDASAAAVYGSRSANGVLLITTKKGKSRKPVVSFSGYTGFQDMTNNPMRVMDAEEFAVRLLDWDWENKVYAWYKTNPTSAAGRPVRPDVTNRDVVAGYIRTFDEKQNYLAGNSIDWVKEVLRKGAMQNYSVSLQGSANNTSYYLSGSYSDIEGIQLNDNFKRMTLRLNLDSKVNEWLTLGVNTSYSYRDNSGIAASLANARVASPLANNYIGQPNYEIYLGGELFQPYPLVNLYIDNSDISNELFAVGSAKIKVPWIQGLQYELNYSHIYTTRDNNTFNSITTPAGVSNRGLAVKNPSESRNWNVNNIITYTGNFGDHQVNSTLLFSRELNKGSSTTANAQGFNNDVLGYNNLGLGEGATAASTAYEENSLAYMARVNYSYKSRYMFTGTVRRDGFSGFGADKKFATFPSASLAWVLSEESFLQDKGLYLKLRTSYGENGNQGIGRYASLSRMATLNYVYGSSTAIGSYPNTLSNADLAWETTASYNIGIDFGFLKNRITGSLDVYTAKTKDVLVQRQLPRAAGYASIWANIGGISNKGIEFNLKSVNINTGNIRWESNFVFALNRDKITKLYGGDKDNDIGNSWFVGESISAIYDYEMAPGGVWTEDEFFKGEVLKGWYPGQFRYVDQNGDGSITAALDRKVIGYKAPSYRFSINNTVSYKNFTLSVFINSIQGGKRFYLADNQLYINPLYYFPDRHNNSAINTYWRPDAPTKNTTGIYNVPLVQSGIYQSRSFVRLQDISLAYSLGRDVLDKLKMQSAQVYVSSKNPYVWTDWQGWDPEIGVSDTPLMRNFIIGLRFSL